MRHSNVRLRAVPQLLAPAIFTHFLVGHSQIRPLEGVDTAKTLEVPWDLMENARMEARHRTESGDFDIRNPDMFIKNMLNTVCMQQIRRLPSGAVRWVDEN